MKFAHFADCHIGGWRDPKLRELGLQSFVKGIGVCLEKKVDFVLVSGDLFDSALPGIDLIKEVARVFRHLNQCGVPVYIIPGSHDFSSSGKTMIDVFDKAGLVVNVTKNLVVDSKTQAIISGMCGRKGGLEVEDYNSEDFSKVSERNGFKIFMFHTLLTELKPKEFEIVDSSSISLLPSGFHYYAGGHPHFVCEKHVDNLGVVVYPGPTFPNNFSELKKLKHGSFSLVEVVGDKLRIESLPIKLKEVASYDFDLSGVSAADVVEKVSFGGVNDKIILLTLKGELGSGKVSDIDFKEIFKHLENAYVVLKNTSKLVSKDEESIEVKDDCVENLETEIINGFVDQDFDKSFVISLMGALSFEKEDGERVMDFEKRVLEGLSEIIK